MSPVDGRTIVKGFLLSSKVEYQSFVLVFCLTCYCYFVVFCSAGMKPGAYICETGSLSRAASPRCAYSMHVWCACVDGYMCMSMYVHGGVRDQAQMPFLRCHLLWLLLQGLLLDLEFANEARMVVSRTQESVYLPCPALGLHVSATKPSIFKYVLETKLCPHVYIASSSLP